MVTDGAAKDFFTDTSKPTIEVVLRGTTPYTNASQLINSTAIQWLRDNADRPDVPYTIILGDKPIPYLRPLPASATRASQGGMGGSPSMYGGGGGSMYGGGGMEMGGMGGGPGMYGGGGQRASSVSSASLQEMLPQNPLLDEALTGDQEFEIRFTLELKNPNAKAEGDTPASPDADSDSPESPQDPAAEPDQAQAPDPPADRTPSASAPTTAALLDEVNS